MEDRLNAVLGADVGFDNLLAARPHVLEPLVIEGFARRYRLIKEFQETTRDLLMVSLRGEADPEIARLIVNELPGQQGLAYHRRLPPGLFTTPVFFRTDEGTPGKISEIQSPGSAWGIYEECHEFCREFEKELDPLTTFPAPLSESFAGALEEYVSGEPLVHHLMDNSSQPHRERYFIQRLREQGVRYYSYDRDVAPTDCNFVRAHDFNSLFYENFAAERRAACAAGKLHYDLPPVALYEIKIPMIFPYWETTRKHYADAIRDMFPYSALVRPDGVALEDGTRLSLNDFAALPPSARDYYIKYAGSDVAINWGSKGVFAARTFSGKKLAELLQSIAAGFDDGRFWIVQKGVTERQSAHYLTREGEYVSADAYTKYSGMYGPRGLMGILVMQRPFFKVHGGADTIVGICG